MRLRKYYNHPRRITYNGIDYIIPYGYKFIATDEDGYVSVFRSKPRRMKQVTHPHWQGSDKHYVGMVDLEGEDWLNTSIELEEETNTHLSDPQSTSLV